ncbi:MAG: ATP-dependent sacrificial sulfur transferase LarE [Spirochaetes bacterium]|nr:ATP-dependent sacrificial sulfur transferase LarE [Spirochaetota bacterium]
MNTDKETQLASSLEKLGRVVIAFSGGVDSSYLLAAAVNTLGKDNVLALTGASESYTEEEMNIAKNVASSLDVRHVILPSGEFDDERFVENSPDRCYYCKKAFFTEIFARAKAEGFTHVLDGTNADDTHDYRPGSKVAFELPILSPLRDAGFSKDDIRRASKKLRLPTWNKPANPCLASRFPYGERITREGIRMVSGAEAFIRSLGFVIVRVRHHGKLARIEVPGKDIRKIMKDGIRGAIDRRLRELGYTWVSIDMKGYRMGSLNEALAKKK